ncbi:protein of unknown function [Nitrospira japonica]|uniref:Uncharacterized protein n=1 Tax=Nitrospira japonica TaxID=1325564 RepID=A0A1W1I9G5_9BACT|nr:protein of unknown function [Nitrospira japonica]
MRRNVSNLRSLKNQLNKSEIRNPKFETITMKEVQVPNGQIPNIKTQKLEMTNPKP